MKKKYAYIILLFFLVPVLVFLWNESTSQTVLRISDYETKKIYVEFPAKEGDRLFFGWTHSWEKIPWYEYYHLGPNNTLVLDTIAFPAFGAGIPENKGTEVWIDKGMIFMGGINQVFQEFDWINSNFATGEIKLNDVLITSGKILPEHTRLILKVEKRRYLDGKR